MLLTLSIHNFLFIKQATLELGSGLSVISGETGAGKSVILESLNFVLGKRLSAGYVGKQADKANVIAEFDIEHNPQIQLLLDEMEIPPEEGCIVIRRILNSNGRSKAYINDVACNSGSLNKLSEHLSEYLGQHGSKGMMDPGEHHNILDKFASLSPELREIEEIAGEYNILNKQLEALVEQEKTAIREIEYLNSLIQELELLDVQPREEEHLEEERKALVRRKEYAQAINNSIFTIEGHILRDLRKVEKYLSVDDRDLGNIANRIESSALELEDISTSLNELTGGGSDNERLANIDNRLSDLRGTSRKYRTNIEELPKLLSDSQESLEQITAVTDKIITIKSQLRALYEDYRVLAERISTRREGAAALLSEKVNNQFSALKMPNARFGIYKEELNRNIPTKFGFERNRFVVSTNRAAEKMQDIGRTASGGELSRIMLAVKVALSTVTSVDTMVFDEVDVGIGGAVAFSVGAKLFQLATHKQVVTITHQPQVAAYSSHHFLVKKYDAQEGTEIKIEKLTEEKKEQEIARMLSGAALTPESIQAARTLIKHTKNA